MIGYAASSMYLFLFLLSLLSTNHLAFGCGQILSHQYTKEGSDVSLNFTLVVSSLKPSEIYFLDLINITTLFKFFYRGNNTEFYYPNFPNVKFESDWLTGNINITFTIRNITSETSGVYGIGDRDNYLQCITVFILDGPENVFLQPDQTNYTINEGDDTPYITCTSRCFPSCSFTWKWENIILALQQSKAILHIGNNITRRQAGVYTCEVKNTQNSSLVQRAQIILNVIWRPSVPIIGTVTSGFPWLEGQTGILNCTADDIGNPPSTVIWKTGDGTTNPLGQLVFNPSTHLHDKKRVICQLQNNFTLSKEEIVESSITLDVQYKPHLSIKRDTDEVNNVTVVEGATVEIMCSGTGNPQPSINWNGASKTSSGGNLTFTNTDRSQAGNYVCVATAISKTYPAFSFSTNKSVSVIVFYPPDVIIQQSGDVIQNQSLELRCLAEGEPNVYNYQKWEQHWRGTDISSFNLQRQEPFISIFSLQLQNSGNYTCRVDNGIRNRMGELVQHATVELLVKVSPMFFADDVMVNGMFSKNTTVSVPFYSYPPSATINVKLQNRTLNQSSNKYMVFIEETIIKTLFYASAVNLNGHLIHFTILNLQESDFDNYGIMLSNAVGSTEWSFTVVSESIPSPPTDFKLIEVSGRMASFIWKRGFNGGQRQTFLLQLSDKGFANWTDKILVEENDDYSNLGNKSYRANITNLKPGSYVVRLLAFNAFGVSEPLVLRTSVEIYSPAEDEPRESQQGAVAGGAVGGTLAAILIICVVLFVLRRYTGYQVCKFKFRRNKSAGNSIKEDYENMSVTTSSLSVCAVNSPETVDDRSGITQYERLRSKTQSSSPYEDLHYPDQFKAQKSDDQGSTTTQSNPSSKHVYYNMQGGKSAEQPHQHTKSGPEHVQYANIRGVRKGKMVSKTNAQDYQEDKPSATVAYSNLKLLRD